VEGLEPAEQVGVHGIGCLFGQEVTGVGHEVSLERAGAILDEKVS
jgi:hypothetical protein